ncbi:MAG: phosphoribosyltransferase [Gammaproteobacteria bacterium]
MNGAADKPTDSAAQGLHCELISWTEVHRLCRRLAALVRDSGFRPDLIVAIGRGGYVPGRLLCDFLHLMGLAGVKVEHYTQGARREPQARVRYPLGIALQDLRVLVVDDVNDSGETFEVILSYLQSLQPRELRTAVMHDKAVSHFRVDYRAKRIVTWRWLIYPWAVVEDITGFIQNMVPPPTSREEAARRLEHDYRIRVPARTLADVYDFMALAPRAQPGANPTVEIHS